MALNPFQNISMNLLADDQKEQAKKLKMSDYTGEAMASAELAMQQAYSRRAPGQARSEELVRRNQANQVSNALKMYGGDANKVAAVSSAATAQSNDAIVGLQAQGQAFSEDAFRNLYMAKRDVQEGKRAYRKDRDALLMSAQQNYYNAIPGGI